MWSQQNRKEMARGARKTMRYPRDLADEELDRLAPLMPKPGRRRHPREVERHEMINEVSVALVDRAVAGACG